MPKRIITLKDKYKSTTFRYPKVLKKCLPEDVREKIDNATLVVANPTLAGTEADLTGLQVGDTKYKVGGVSVSPKYLVHVEIERIGYGDIYFTVLKDDDTNFTFDTLLQKFTALGISSTGYIGASGYWFDNNSYNNIVSIGSGYNSTLQSNVLRCQILSNNHTFSELEIPIDNNLTLRSIRKERIV